MEKQNLPYRYLRNQKTQSSKLVRKSLILPLRKKQTLSKQGGDKNEKNSIMSQNVSQYLHMLSNCHIKENYIKWAINLRASSPIKNLSMKESVIPDTYFKNTKVSMMKQQENNKQEKQKFNTAEYHQFLEKSKKNHPINESNLAYATSLRGYSDYSKDKDLQKQRFSSLPSKNKIFCPSFLKKDFIKKTKEIKEDNLQSSLDGAQNYPHYTENILKNKNYGFLKTFVSTKQKPSLPTLAWQVGLRSY